AVASIVDRKLAPAPVQETVSAPTAAPAATVATAAPTAAPTTAPVAIAPPPRQTPPLAGPIEGSEIASLDEHIRFVPTTRPTVPEPEHPPEATPENVDTNRPPHEWQRLTDDWFGARPWLDDHGVSFQASLTFDSSKVLSGGLSTDDWANRHLFNANITVD